MSLPKPTLRLARASLSLLTVSVLAACATAPLPPAPAPLVASAFKESSLWQAAKPAAAVPEAWWQAFGDPVLNDLQARLVIGNENLKAAVAQVAAARAALGSSRAAEAPTLGASLNASRSDSGTKGSSASNTLQLAASASWEADLWGRLGQATQASNARLQASQADLAAARLSAQATLTQSYFALRAAELQQTVITRSVAAYQRSLELTRARYQSGVVGQTDVLQAQITLESAQVQALESSNQRAQLEHAIAVLLGLPPAALNLARAAPEADLPAPPAVPELLPSTLLQRRPDIAAAERRVAAAYAQIGVADVAFFPSLTLSANPGLRGSNLGQLTSAPALYWSVGAALAQKIFDGGALRAASQQALANADQATASYRQTVLTALQEVEDNLLLAHQLQAETALQAQALQHAQRNLEITQEQYRVGTVSYLNVVTAQATALGSERTLLDLRTRQLNAVNQLLKNIAGRW